MLSVDSDLMNQYVITFETMHVQSEQIRECIYK